MSPRARCRPRKDTLTRPAASSCRHSATETGYRGQARGQPGLLCFRAVRQGGEHRLVGGLRRDLRPAAPLTEREIAVLHLLGGTLSLREIGQELFVSANTVKTHTQAIYRKLGVSSRTEAVEQGRELGI